MSSSAYHVEPIGYVSATGRYALVIDEAYRPALAELEGFSHITILWWCHQLDDPLFREMTIAERPYKHGPAAVGIFATRSPARPNPIALTVAQLLTVGIENGIVELGFIDADDGTPVLDIKPYLPAVDRVRTTRSPEWCADWPNWLEDSATFDWGAVFENAQ